MAQLLTIAEAAQRLRVSRSTLYDLIMAGRLGSVKIGRLRRVPSSAVDAFIAALESEPEADGEAGSQWR